MTRQEKAVLEKFLEKHDECMKASEYVWTLAASHGMGYKGPDYQKEMAALRRLIGHKEKATENIV